MSAAQEVQHFLPLNSVPRAMKCVAMCAGSRNCSTTCPNVDGRVTMPLLLSLFLLLNRTLVNLPDTFV